MYKNESFLAIIPARGGSKGIPKKNITEVKSKPLIEYTIQEAKESKYLDRIIVSTDDPRIASVSEKCGAEVPFLRPAILANDHSKTIDALIHAITELKDQGYYYDNIVLLQPTQPLRKCWHIDEAVEKITNSSEDSLVSISEVKEHPILMRKIGENGKLINLLEENSTIRRQDFPIYYKVNGAIYINKINENFNNRLSLNDNKLPYIMESKYDLDIDTPLDMELFNLLLSEGY